MFHEIEAMKTIFKEHSDIQPTKLYTDEEKYNLCNSLLLHMKEEEHAVKTFLLLKKIPDLS